MLLIWTWQSVLFWRERHIRTEHQWPTKTRNGDINITRDTRHAFILFRVTQEYPLSPLHVTEFKQSLYRGVLTETLTNKTLRQKYQNQHRCISTGSRKCLDIRNNVQRVNLQIVFYFFVTKSFVTGNGNPYSSFNLKPKIFISIKICLWSIYEVIFKGL